MRYTVLYSTSRVVLPAQHQLRLPVFHQYNKISVTAMFTATPYLPLTLQYGTAHPHEQGLN